ncbi:MAG: DinB family protein [Spirochaetia bacterium]|jgi:uncharacterized damage-inducible protein DinB
MKETLARLMDHLCWADNAVLQNLGGPRHPAGKAMDYFAHVLAAEKLWIERIEGKAPAVVAVWPRLALADCASLAESNHATLKTILEAESAGGFTREISYARSTGERYTGTVGDILLHLAMHGSYHRGQVAAAVRAGGGEPVNTDFIHYIRTRGAAG